MRSLLADAAAEVHEQHDEQHGQDGPESAFAGEVECYRQQRQLSQQHAAGNPQRAGCFVFGVEPVAAQAAAEQNDPAAEEPAQQAAAQVPEECLHRGEIIQGVESLGGIGADYQPGAQSEAHEGGEQRQQGNTIYYQPAEAAEGEFAFDFQGKSFGPGELCVHLCMESGKQNRLHPGWDGGGLRLLIWRGCDR